MNKDYYLVGILMVLIIISGIFTYKEFTKNIVLGPYSQSKTTTSQDCLTKQLINMCQDKDLMYSRKTVYPQEITLYCTDHQYQIHVYKILKKDLKSCQNK